MMRPLTGEEYEAMALLTRTVVQETLTTRCSKSAQLRVNGQKLISAAFHAKYRPGCRPKNIPVLCRELMKHLPKDVTEPGARPVWRREHRPAVTSTITRTLGAYFDSKAKAEPAERPDWAVLLTVAALEGRMDPAPPGAAAPPPPPPPPPAASPPALVKPATSRPNSNFTFKTPGRAATTSSSSSSARRTASPSPPWVLPTPGANKRRLSLDDVSVAATCGSSHKSRKKVRTGLIEQEQYLRKKAAGLRRSAEEMEAAALEVAGQQAEALRAEAVAQREAAARYEQVAMETEQEVLLQTNDDE